MSLKIILTRFTACALFLGSLGSAALPLTANAAASAAHYQRLFYYRDGPLAKKSFFAHAKSIDVFAPQVYSLLADGTLSGTLAPDLLAFAKKNKIKVMPLVTNGNFSPAAFKALLKDPAKEDTAINALVYQAKTYGYWGWQVDFEQMKAEDKDAFSAFIARAANALHGNGLVLSVAVVGKVSDTPSDYKGQLWDNLIGAYDYDALGKTADFISLMSYDDPESSGPIAPMPWVKRVLTYTLAHIPANKVSLGIALYYWKWSNTTHKLLEIGGNEGIQNVFKNHPLVEPAYDSVSEAPYLMYATGGNVYTLWYENSRSIASKVALVKQYKLYGVSAWTLGLELSSVYASLK
jgi:spore germination protein YaaH